MSFHAPVKRYTAGMRGMTWIAKWFLLSAGVLTAAAFFISPVGDDGASGLRQR